MGSSTAAMTATAAPAKTTPPARDPKDSMKSTWRTDRTIWNKYHHLLHFLNVYPTDLDKPVPIHQKTDKVPYMTQWSTNLWIILHAAWPMALHRLYIWTFGKNMPALGVFFLYTLAFQLNAIHEVRTIRRLGHVLGFLDGDKHERDGVPDHAAGKVFSSLQLTTVIRPIFTIFLSYRSNKLPELTLWLPLELFLYSIILDGWFYLYHRSCHELDSLWQYHRTHHLTKHPNAMLSAYADHEQEILEIAIIPLLTYVCLKLVGMPMTFEDWWVCHEFLIFSEAFGHSGLRAYMIVPGVSNVVLKWFGMELAIEDHDLHHRHGWRKSANYGKQTRFWDSLFGTTAPRIESCEGNVDFENKINFPLW